MINIVLIIENAVTMRKNGISNWFNDNITAIITNVMWRKRCYAMTCSRCFTRVFFTCWTFTIGAEERRFTISLVIFELESDLTLLSHYWWLSAIMSILLLNNQKLLPGLRSVTVTSRHFLKWYVLQGSVTTWKNAASLYTLASWSRSTTWSWCIFLNQQNVLNMSICIIYCLYYMI